MSTEVVMPQMGESIAEGTITKWLKQVGERVERDEPLFEISTDKVDAEIPSPAAGTLTEIRFKEGDTVEINTTVAVLDGGATAGAAPVTASTVTAAKEAQPEQKQSEATAAKAQSAETVTPAPQAAPAGKAEAAQPKAEPAPAAAETVAQQKPPAAPRKESSGQTAQPTGNGGGAAATAEELRRTKSSPLVRKIAQEHGVDIAGLEGTGMSGRVTKNDILSFIESGAPAAAPARTTQASPAAQAPAAPSLKPAEGDRVEQMTVMRKKIAEHMVVSRRTSAHVTTVYEIDMTRIAKLR
ncbi:MAG: biotin/lipoyl-containing protein, partial [bacterium]